MSASKAPKAPAGLGTRGRRLWRQVVADYELSVADVELLTEACRCADDAERLALELADQPVLVVGSAGQPRANPLAKELRDTRNLLGQLLGRLDFPADDSGNEWDGLTASHRARKAARARWSRGA